MTPSLRASCISLALTLAAAQSANAVTRHLALSRHCQLDHRFRLVLRLTIRTTSSPLALHAMP